MTLLFLKDVANDAVQINPQIKNYVIIPSLKSVQQWVGKQINRIPGSRLSISS